MTGKASIPSEAWTANRSTKSVAYVVGQYSSIGSLRFDYNAPLKLCSVGRLFSVQRIVRENVTGLAGKRSEGATNG